MGAEKISLKNEQKFIFQFLLKIEIAISNSFFNLIMKTKNEKNSNFYFILKQKPNVPFRTHNPCMKSIIQKTNVLKNKNCIFFAFFKNLKNEFPSNLYFKN